MRGNVRLDQIKTRLFWLVSFVFLSSPDNKYVYNTYICVHMQGLGNGCAHVPKSKLWFYRHHLQLPTSMNGNGNSAFYYATKRSKRLCQEIREIEETMSRYLTLPKEWDFLGGELLTIIVVIGLVIILVTSFLYLQYLSWTISTNTIFFVSIVKCMGKWWLPARFLFLTTGQIWMTSGHRGR